MSESGRQPMSGSTPETPPPCPDRVNVLLVGSGGREHALAWKLRQSPRLGRLWVDPQANAGLRELGEPCPHSIAPQQRFFLKQWCDAEGIDLVVIGPDQRLEEGLADALEAAPKRLVFGPKRAAARIEWDKAWAKQIMRTAAVPTAEARVFDHADQAFAYLDTREDPVVIKAAGLCLGKGVVVADTRAQAEEAIHRFMVERIHGDAGSTVVIEEKLEGPEVSLLALVDGRTLWMLDSAQDHKRVGDGDTGPNTGGMGAYSPTPIATPEILARAERDILIPVIDAMRLEGAEFRGVLYAGLMITPAGPKVLEFNARFGDPETQVIIPRLKGDLISILWATASGQLDSAEISFDSRPACCVVVCAEGYPGAVRKGEVIHSLPSTGAAAGGRGDLTDDSSTEVLLFHAGTQRDKAGQLVTSGGRVIGVTALAPTLVEACQAARSAAEQVRFKGAFHRRDIGAKAIGKAIVPTESDFRTPA
ncbi:MAG: phosphoribosylamine--glycine ligase [Phycisphaeraceae bacterium]|nr:phosphoribosylamine--glycine ligase [Phycisphaeraceae bacterium]